MYNRTKTRTCQINFTNINCKLRLSFTLRSYLLIRKLLVKWFNLGRRILTNGRRISEYTSWAKSLCWCWFNTCFELGSSLRIVDFCSTYWSQTSKILWCKIYLCEWWLYGSWNRSISLYIKINNHYAWLIKRPLHSYLR